MPNLLLFLAGFLFNFIVAFAIVRFIYYPKTHNKRYVFTFLAFNTIIYFVLSFMTSIEFGVGVGFGLFAIFSILRYRTDPIPIREMTYLFVIAALPVMNSAGVDGDTWLQLILANVAVMIILFFLEHEWGFQYEAYKHITYEKIDLINPEKRSLLLADLEARTGLKIKRCVIGKVNFLRDTAELMIYYDDPGDQNGWHQSANTVLIYQNDDDEN